MHPVLKSALEPLAEQIAPLSMEEAQVAPLPGQGRWCAQQIMEHLILTYKMTSDSVSKQLKSGRVPKNRRNLLEFFLTHTGRAYSREQLLESVWGEQRFVTPRTVDVHVRRLREQIEEQSENPRYLTTVRGFGYRFEEPQPG